MTNPKRFSGTRCLRALWIAALLTAACGFGAGTALAEKDSDAVQNSADKTERGFGELLKGMGQEVKKVIGSDDKAAKKDKKDEKKHPENEPDKGKDDTK
jgi:gas vesicle protein